MSKKFIKLQLFGDPSGDPSKAPDTSVDGKNQPGADGVDTAPNAAEELYDFQKNYVTKEKYDEAVKRGDEYLKAIINHTEKDVLQKEGVNPPKVDVQNLARKTFSEDNQMSDLDYCKNVLKIRNAQIEAGAIDPFLPPDPDDRDYVIAENVADVLEQCITEAKGNNASFIALFQSRLKDVPLPKNFLRR